LDKLKGVPTAGELKFPEIEDFLAELFKCRFSNPESQFQNALAQVNDSS
jgi:hypothetical protein